MVPEQFTALNVSTSFQSPSLECSPVSSLLLESQVRTEGVFPGEVPRVLTRRSLLHGMNYQCHSFGPQGVPLCLIFALFLTRWPSLSGQEAGLSLLRNPGLRVVPYIDSTCSEHLVSLKMICHFISFSRTSVTGSFSNRSLEFIHPFPSPPLTPSCITSFLESPAQEPPDGSSCFHGAHLRPVHSLHSNQRLCKT